MVKRVVAGVKVPAVASNEELTLFALEVYAALGFSYIDAGQALDVSPATVWKLINNEQGDSPLLRKKWNIRKTSKRPRVHMPTNNLERAMEIVSKYYPNVEVTIVEPDKQESQDNP